MKSVPSSTPASAFSRPQRYGLLPVFLFISGAVALVYEIVWQRQFALLFGSATPATAAVLAGYFAGLGVGAFVIGRWAGKWTRPLRAYAVLELMVGVGALIVTPLLAGFEQAYPWLYESLSGRPGLFMTIRTAVVFAVVLIPTFCMGGTLPLLGQWVDRGQQRLGLTAGWLYVVNTVGAGLGALAVPFLLLPQLGLAHTVWLCVTLNGLLALAAWWLDRRTQSAVQTPVTVLTSPKNLAKEKQIHPPTPVIFLALVSGVVTFALQVLWNRAFAQVHENSMYSFSVIVAVVIFALAIGAQLARLGLRWGFAPRRLIGGAWIAAGFIVLSGPWVFFKLSNGLSYLAASGGWTAHAIHLTGFASAIILIPMALLGIGLPAIMEQAGRNSSDAASRVLGRLLAANIMGSVVGALAAGFILPQWLGLWGSIFWLGSLILAAGLWQWPQWTNPRSRQKFALILGVVWLAALWPAMNLSLPRVRLAVSQEEKLIALSEGPHGITAVVERTGSRRLKLNNHYGLGGTGSTGDERMQAHIPLLLHPAPQQVAFLGLGTGITAGGALFHPIDRLTVMELVPEVAAAARTHFREANQGVLDDPRTVVVADDARHYLRGSVVRFDVIVGDLVVPWRQGEGALFTREQFEAAREALAPRGLFCQWLPLFQLSEVEANILARTFLTVFPHAQVWRGDFSPTEPAIALIGSAEDLPLDVESLRRRLTQMQPDDTNPQLQSTDAFWMNYVGELHAADLPASDKRINQEDRPWIELLGPMLHSGGDQEKLFTGRRLQTWLDQVMLRSQNRMPPLPAQERSAVHAGQVFSEMMLCVAEDNRSGATVLRDRLEKMLPPATFQRLFQ